MASPAIRGEAFERLKSAISALDTPERREAYREGRFPRANRVRDLDRRYRWDLFWHAHGPALLRGSQGFMEFKDDHIDTALRRIVPPLEVTV